MTTWTKEPPTFNHEGRTLPDARPYWWFRYPSADQSNPSRVRGGPWIICRDAQDASRWWWFGSDIETTTDELVCSGGEWFPIPIQPPPTEQEKPDA